MGRTIDNLQALRGVACMLVLAFHLSGWERELGLTTPVFREFLKFGEGGVDLFFVLSGFIITHINARDFGRPAAVPGYLFRRLWRILPTCWAATIACAALVSWSLNQTVFKPNWESNWVRYALLLPGDPSNPYVPAWTLTFEVMFYFAFTVLMILPPRVGAGLLGLWGAAVLVLSLTWQYDPQPYRATAISPFVLEFLGGCGVAYLFNRGVTAYGRTAVLLGVAAVAVAGFAVQAWSGEPWTTLSNRQHHRVLTFGPAAVLIVYGMVAAEARGTVRAPRWLRKIGDASYSIYLTHVSLLPIAVIYGARLPHDRWPHTLWVIGTFWGCVAAGFAFYYAVERPLLMLGRRKKAKPTAAVVQEPAPGIRKAA